MANVAYDSKLRSVVRLPMHPSLGNWLAIRLAVVYYVCRLPVHLVQELNVGTVDYLN